MFPRFIFVYSLLVSIGCADEIKSLPGLKGKLNFRHYSGYLQTSATHHLHYIFTESQNDPAKDPLVLWLNGGPGCSSVGGLLTELGPYLVVDNAKKPTINKYAWNKKANIIALESPAGVGFSYSDDGDVRTSDTQTAKENYVALVKFFEEFPQFKSNDFYVFGESYGGIYAPTLVSEILRRNAMSRTQIHIKGQIGQNDLNPYDLYSDCYKGSLIHSTRYAVDMHMMSDFMPPKSPISNLNHSNNAEAHKGMMRCMDERGVTDYLNREDVRQALHIPKNVPRWVFCRDDMVLGRGMYRATVRSVESQSREALKAGLRLLFYYGDTDMVCNVLMGQKFAERLGQGKYKMVKSKTAWYLNHQTAGFVTKYTNVTFYTVKGAGHMVPQFRPAQALHLFNSWLDEGRTP